MFGQWSLGASSLGQPEEFSLAQPEPANAIVWFSLATEACVSIVDENTIVQVWE